MQSANRYTRWLWLILIVGLVLRIVYALQQPTVELFYGADGGDAGWYLANGWGFFSGKPHGWIRGAPFYLSNLPTAPLYILYAGLWQQFLPDELVVQAMLLTQSFLSIATAYLAYRITFSICGDERAGLLSAGLLAFHPAFIIESGTVATETLYIFFVTAGLWLLIEWIIPQKQGKWSITVWLMLAGTAFGLATLTRAVLLVFPLGLLLHFLLVGGREKVGLWFRRGIILLVVYGAVVLTWTVYNLGMWGTFVIGSNQFMPALWRGAVSVDGTPQENDALLLENADDVRPEGCDVDCKYQHSTETYVEQISESIGGNIAGFIAHRVKELANAYLQPHGTTPLGGISVRDGALDWLRDDRSVGGLVTLLQTEGFFIKLVVWLFHYGGLFLGLMGIWLSRKQWRLTLPLIGFIAYTTLLHLVLLALPRYIFPTEVPFLIMASVAIITIYDKLRHRTPQIVEETA